MNYSNNFASALSIIAIVLLVGGCGSNDRTSLPLTTNSDEARDMYEKGMFAIDSGNRSAARSFYEKGLELDSNFAMLWLKLAAVDRENRWSHVERAKSLFPNISDGEQTAILADEAAWRGDRRMHDSLIAVVAESYPGDYRYCQYMGNVLGSRHMRDSALYWYELAIENRSDFPRAYNDLAWTYFLKGDDSRAKRLFDKYVELEPASARSLFSLGDFYLGTGDNINAIGNFEKGLSFEPSDNDLRIASVLAKAIINDTAGVQSTIEDWQQVAPDQVRQQRQAQAMNHVVHNRGSKAVSIMLGQTQEDIRNKEFTRAFFGLVEVARLLIFTDQYAAAEKALSGARDALKSTQLTIDERARRLRAHIPVNCLLDLLRGDLLSAESRLADYVNISDTIIRFRERETYHELLGNIALERQDFAEALNQLHQANIETPLNMYRIGEAYLGLNDFPQARKMFINAIRTVNYNITYLYVRKWATERLATIP